MAVADADAAAPLHARTFVDPDHAEHPLSVTGQAVLLLKDRPAMRFHDIRYSVDHLAMGNRLPARGSGRSRNQCDLVTSDELPFTHRQSHNLYSCVCFFVEMIVY